MIGAPVGAFTQVKNGVISGTSFPFTKKIPTSSVYHYVQPVKPVSSAKSVVSSPAVSAVSSGSVANIASKTAAPARPSNITATLPTAPQVNSVADQIASLKGIAQSNNAASAEQARIQREWQEAQNAKAMQFNASEAAKNRDWQEMMSNTAHQREVRDLMAAGLNPVLSAMNGNGAAVGSGATASGVTSAGAKGEIDTSSSAAIVNLLGSILAAQTQLEAANINARTQEAVADKYTAMEGIVASIGAGATRYYADQHYKGYRDSAVLNLGGNLFRGLAYALGKIGF